MTNPIDDARIDTGAALEFLSAHFDPESVDVEPLGSGAWSQAFGFRRGDDELVARFGRHVNDFEKDRRAHAYRVPHLPIPEVLAIGPAFDGYYAVSTRMHGAVLESREVEWATVVPSLVDVLEALRLADLAETEGFGMWDGDGNATHGSWTEYLLAVGDDTPDRRTHGWREWLTADPGGWAAFTWGFERLQQTTDDSVPRSLIHADLINSNVLVEGGCISGVFDWGCAAYGDHLYDLAWFEFWADWHPNIDVPLLRSELERRWRETGYDPPNMARRLSACHLHIGLDHLAYNAFRGDAAAVAATAKRMRALVGA